ncbi:hypothetical protein OHA25_57445 [Nonomuraea sp. NBC_00507]|uniref:hypothetical protein n=1 Tax=Nonomuraea sp. NBC_00507 TaxID=2976002 RepID=UPI002E16D5B0
MGGEGWEVGERLGVLGSGQQVERRDGALVVLPSSQSVFGTTPMPATTRSAGSVRPLLSRIPVTRPVPSNPVTRASLTRSTPLFR